MNLRFEGDLSLWQGVLLALLFAGLIWSLYWREVGRRRWLSLLLPIVRAVAVLLIILMLTGPVLHRRVEVGDLSRVLVFVDESESMSLVDETMSPGRKLINAQRMGLLRSGSLDTSLHDAAQSLDRAQEAIALIDEMAAEEIDTTQPSDIKALAKALKKQIHEAQDHLRKVDNETTSLLSESGENLPPSLAEQFENEVVDELEQLSIDSGLLSRERRQSGDLKSLAAAVVRWQLRLDAHFNEYVGKLIERGDTDLTEALDRFDKLTRWQRIESSLLTRDDAVLTQLKDKHHLELLATSGDTSEENSSRRLWWPQETLDVPEALNPQSPVGPSTNLVNGMKRRIAQHSSDQTLAVVLLSDGQHNHETADTDSPIKMAKVMGSRGVPVYAVGYGAKTPPRDLAVLAVNAPESVFAEDRVKGEILLKDNMPAGTPMQVKIEIDGEQVWQEQLTTANSHRRTLQFDFPIKELVEDRVADSTSRMDALSLPLPIKVIIDPVDGELREDNNSSEIHVRAVTRRRRLLLIDGRPRWEYRYIESMFDRDEQWEVNAIIADPSVSRDPKNAIVRGDQLGEFPDDRDELFSYDLIILGEVPRNALRLTELEWINQFVSSRGGGLMLIDGRRGKLRDYSDTPIEAMLPIKWKGSQSEGFRATRLSLTPQGQTTAALNLESDSAASTERWSQLPPPRWVAPVVSLPGCETLVEALRGEQRSSALVLRRFGAGNVLYAAHDESWRWRYEVADQFHSRFWNQIAGWIMEPPYAVHDKFVSIDTGGFTYEKGESADLRVRLRNEQGDPVLQATAEAIIYQDGEVVATLPLKADDNDGGIFRATTDKLAEGTYEVGVRATGFAEEQLKARAAFAVLGDPRGEMNVLHCDEDLLRQVAHHSGGQYLREEEIGSLPELLAPLSDGHIEDRETVLWRSWFWFMPLMGLFTAEWIIRKKAGLI